MTNAKFDKRKYFMMGNALVTGIKKILAKRRILMYNVEKYSNNINYVGDWYIWKN